MMFIVFDLDGTLALNEHRQHFVQRPPGEKKDWDAFFEACDKDEPNKPIVDTLKAFRHAGHRVEIWSGRSAQVIVKTQVWLSRFGLHTFGFRCRPEGDHTPDTELKARWLEEAIAADRKPDLVFEDRASVVAMWRANGIPCCQVAPGDF